MLNDSIVAGVQKSLILMMPSIGGKRQVLLAKRRMEDRGPTLKPQNLNFVRDIE